MSVTVNVPGDEDIDEDIIMDKLGFQPMDLYNCMRQLTVDPANASC